MAGIFINYRRDDAPGVAGRLFDHLAVKFSRERLFMDVDAMTPGRDFVEQLEIQVSQCRVLLAIIGPHWLDAKDHSGKRRLEADNDYVRIELAAALKRDIPVVPVLVDGATMPDQDSLPHDLQSLTRRHALELRHTRFNADADAIVHALETVVPPRRIPWAAIAGGGVVVAAIAAALFFWPQLSARLHPAAKPPAVIAAKPPTTAPAPAPVPPTNPAPPPAAPAPAAPGGAVAPTSQPPTTPPSTATPAPSAPIKPTPSGQTVASLMGTTTPSGLPADVKVGDMMKGISFPGSVLHRMQVDDDPGACQAACRVETHCVVWTFAQPAAAGQSARCDLKAVIPAAIADTCCTSAIERVPPPELRVPPPVSPGVDGARPGMELDGGTYRYFGGAGATPAACQTACRADGRCLAWDYARPGTFSPDARCFLKNKPGLEVSSPCCVAGFERDVADAPPAAPAPAAGTAPAGGSTAAGTNVMPNTNLYGADYRHIDFATNDWASCQSACKADNKCLAWTLVRPGVQVPKARCWLKNKIPQRIPSTCCTSGIIERAAAK